MVLPSAIRAACAWCSSSPLLVRVIVVGPAGVLGGRSNLKSSAAIDSSLVVWLGDASVDGDAGSDALGAGDTLGADGTGELPGGVPAQPASTKPESAARIRNNRWDFMAAPPRVQRQRSMASSHRPASRRRSPAMVPGRERSCPSRRIVM